VSRTAAPSAAAQQQPHPAGPARSAANDNSKRETHNTEVRQAIQQRGVGDIPRHHISCPVAAAPAGPARSAAETH
jgi:hypothetical protein